jgi:hypothetical protein
VAGAFAAALTGHFESAPHGPRRPYRAVE